MDKITDLSVYNSNMQRSIVDKIFFTSSVDTDLYVDFGCANGVMLGWLEKILPNHEYIGYDISEEMIQQARLENPNIKFWGGYLSSLDTFKEWLESTYKGKTKTLILSSIIHEVYSYGTNETIKEFWEFVYSGVFDYIVIRDMMLSETANRDSDVNDMMKIIKKEEPTKVQDFISNWGLLDTQKNLIHYLFKYRFIENWKREVKENYFPISKEYLLKNINNDYTINYYEHYTFPFNKNIIQKDFDINITDNTHIKLILKKTN